MSNLSNTYQEITRNCTSNLATHLDVQAFAEAATINKKPLEIKDAGFSVTDLIYFKPPYSKTICRYCLDGEPEANTRSAPFYSKALWHPKDLECFTKEIFPEVISFLQSKPVFNFKEFSFSFNYRLRVDNNYISVLQQSTFTGKWRGACPVLTVENIVDITAHKADNLIVHTISGVAQTHSSFCNPVLFKSVHNPEQAESLLSKRELQILRAVQTGLSSKAIASQLFISLHTVNNHRKKMLAKTKTRNFNDLLQYASKNGLLQMHRS